MTFERLLLIFFDRFWAIFGPVWRHIRPFLALYGTKIGSFWGDFGPFLDRTGVILGSLRYHFGIILGSFCCAFDPFGLSWGLFGQKENGSFGEFGSKCIETLKHFFEEDT